MRLDCLNSPPWPEAAPARNHATWHQSFISCLDRVTQGEITGLGPGLGFSYGFCTHLAELLWPFCLYLLSPSRVGDSVEQPQSKSTLPRSETCLVTLYISLVKLIRSLKVVTQLNCWNLKLRTATVLNGISMSIFQVIPHRQRSRNHRCCIPPTLTRSQHPERRYLPPPQRFVSKQQNNLCSFALIWSLLS